MMEFLDTPLVAAIKASRALIDAQPVPTANRKCYPEGPALAAMLQALDLPAEPHCALPGCNTFDVNCFRCKPRWTGHVEAGAPGDLTDLLANEARAWTK